MNESFNRGWAAGVAYVLKLADDLASPDDWNVPSVYPSILRREVEQDLQHTTDLSAKPELPGVSEDEVALIQLAIGDAINVIRDWLLEKEPGGYYSEATIEEFHVLDDKVERWLRAFDSHTDDPEPETKELNVDPEPRGWTSEPMDLCIYCGEEFTPTISNPNKCSDCTRRAYK